RDASVSTVDAQGRTQQHVLALSKLSGEVADSDKTLDQIGLAPKPIDAVIGDVPDGPAARAGLRKGDRILRVGDVRVATFGEFAKAIQDQAAKNPRLHLLVDRAGGQLDLDVVAERKDMGSGMRWYINVAPPESRVVERYGPLRAIPMALHESWKTAHSMLSVIGGMLTGQASAKNLSSVISIAQAANASAQLGLGYFLSFLAVISLSLGILNLLPIPILDGGHLLYYLIESVKGSPLNERAMIAGQYVGLAVLVTLMSIAFYNDILRQVSG
ncbi:MAG TPA: RIP metalloprotease RseP, partial [Rudaea sp.]|nr:RIP metalloprotease RseP [Rudaea sp.]